MLLRYIDLAKIEIAFSDDGRQVVTLTYADGFVRAINDVDRSDFAFDAAKYRFRVQQWKRNRELPRLTFHEESS